MIFLFFLLFSFSFRALKLQNVVPCSYLFFKGKAEIQISLGNQNNTNFYGIDLQVPFTWTLPSYYLQNKFLMDYEIYTVFFGGFPYLAHLHSAPLQLYDRYNHKIIVSEFTFFSIIDHEKDSFNHEGLGLGINEKKEFSIVHLLKKNGYIEKLEFGILPRNQKGTLYFGGIPSEIRNNKKYKAYIKTYNNTWSATLNSIHFYNTKSKSENKFSITFIDDLKGNSYIYENIIYFQMNINTINVPENFMKYLTQVSFFNQLINKGICIYVNSSTEIYISCNYQSFSSFPDYIVFSLSGIPFSFKIAELFECNKKNCKFLMTHLTNKENSFIFGYVFMSKFLSEFNLEAKSITFYSNTPFGIPITLNKEILKNFVKYFSFCLSFFFFLLIIIKKKLIKIIDLREKDNSSFSCKNDSILLL